MEHTVKQRQSVHARKQSCLAAVSMYEDIHAAMEKLQEVGYRRKD